jgi:hypothetical protein
MRVITEDSQATVLGTRFEINSSELSTLLEVSEGSVRLEQTLENRSVDVGQNEFAVSDLNSGIEVRPRGAPRYRSPLITVDTPGRSVDIEVDVRGAKTLYLVTTNGEDNNRFDHVVWLDPVLTGEKTYDLTRIPWTRSKSGWQESRINSGLFGGKIRVNKMICEKGLTTHATSVIAYDLPPNCHTFKTRAALLDSGANQENSEASVRFEVYTELPEETLRKLEMRRRFY